jgi:hypothetical protein
LVIACHFMTGKVPPPAGELAGRIAYCLSSTTILRGPAAPLERADQGVPHEFVARLARAPEAGEVRAQHRRPPSLKGAPLVFRAPAGMVCGAYVRVSRHIDGSKRWTP